MKDNIYVMGEEREESAKEFLESLDDEQSLNCTINMLDNVKGVLLEYAGNLGVAESKKNSEAIMMIYYLNATINALKYIGIHDVPRKEE